MKSVWLKLNTCPTGSDPLALGGGVSMAEVSGRGADSAAERSKVYVSESAQRATHFCSRPSSEGLSGTPTVAPGAVLSRAEVSVTMTGILRAMSTSVSPGRGNADPELARVEQALL